MASSRAIETVRNTLFCYNKLTTILLNHGSLDEREAEAIEILLYTSTYLGYYRESGVSHFKVGGPFLVNMRLGAGQHYHNSACTQQMYYLDSLTRVQFHRFDPSKLEATLSIQESNDIGTSTLACSSSTYVTADTEAKDTWIATSPRSSR